LMREPVGDTTVVTQDCLAPRTSMPLAISAIVLVMGAIALFMCFLYVLFQI
jgi:hypothetical protein